MKQLDELLKNSKELGKLLDVSISEYENKLTSDLSDLKGIDKESIENAKRITQTALELAKKGDVSGINNLINSFKDASKNNKA